MPAQARQPVTQPFPVRAHLIPFVTRVLFRGSNERHQPRHWPLPAGNKDLYTAQDLEAMKQIFSQGVLFCFARTGEGWHKRHVLQGREPWSSQQRHLRLWESAQSLELKFGADALQLCEHLYNLSANRNAKKQGQGLSRAQDAQRLCKLSLETVAEQALTYWMIVGLWPQITHKGHADAWDPLLDHLTAQQPMMALRYGPWTQGALPDKDALVASFQGPARALLPWWAVHALDWWQLREPDLWALDQEAYVRVRQRQRALLTAWIEAARQTQWLHLLPPLLRHFQVQERWLVALLRAERAAAVPHDAWHHLRASDQPPAAQVAEAALARLTRSFKSQRHQERQELRDAWAQTLGACGLLHQAWRDCVQVHHADREVYDKYLVDWGARSQIQPLAQRLEEIARIMEGRLG